MRKKIKRKCYVSLKLGRKDEVEVRSGEEEEGAEELG